MQRKISFFIFMLTIALSTTPIARSAFRFASNLVKISHNKHFPSTHDYTRTLALYTNLPTQTFSMTHSAMDNGLSTSLPSTGVDPAPKIQPELPKLSVADFQTYNKLAVMMEYYHNHFRHTWQTLYTACEKNKRPGGMSISQFINTGLQFISHLTVHHGIEENHIFPILAKNMPEFRPKSTMVTQHKQIHDGLDRLEAYLTDVKRGEKELRLSGDGSLKEVMDSFGTVLWQHLDEEVRNLGAENMRKYWTKQDMARLNF